MSDFVYRNVNPKKAEGRDCVCRAICLASALPYHTVERLLSLVAKSYECDELCVCCYHHLLEDVFGYKHRYCEDGETVGDIAKKYPRNTIIVRIEGHLTACVNGACYDIWNCTDEQADCYWVVERA